MDEAEQNALTERVIGCAMRVHSTLGQGFVEPVYKRALACELKKQTVAHEVEKAIQVRYEGLVVGEFSADILVENWLICELKAVSTLLVEHEIQLVNYLTAMKQDFGLLINFGTKSLQVKRKYKRAATLPIKRLSV